jgi:conjugal transfer/type IV secretion protein DotA/TraY
MKNLGDYVLTVGDTAVIAYATAEAAISAAHGFSVVGAAASTVNFFTSTSDIVQGVMKVLGPLIYAIMGSCFALGLSLSVYLPLVPFVVWFGGVINWLVVIGEAVIAAPLWAMTHIAGEGEGLGHRTGHGYIFFLNVMVRGLLMVVGFFLGGAAIIVAGTLLNRIFAVALANVQFNSVTGIGTAIGFIWLYASLSINMVHRCFNLILIVPDQVINWVGGHAATTVGRDAADAAGQSLTILGGKVDNVSNSRLPEMRKPPETKDKEKNGMKDA